MFACLPFKLEFQGLFQRFAHGGKGGEINAFDPRLGVAGIGRKEPRDIFWGMPSKQRGASRAQDSHGTFRNGFEQ